MKTQQLRFKKHIIQMIYRMMTILFAISFFLTTAYSQIATTTPASRCGAGTLVLHATATSGTITWYAVPFYGTPLGTGVTYTTPDLEVTTTYYVDAVSAGCSLNISGGVNTGRVPVIATISDNSIQAAIFYSSTTFCNSVATPQTPTRTGTADGNYTAPGLTINASTGAFTPSANANGTYTVTYTVSPAEGCVENPALTTLTITTAPVAPAISYGGSPWCTSHAAVTVLQTGATGGVYSAVPSGLTINASDGTITPSSSLTGHYTITYFKTGAGGCLPMTATATVDILQLPTASISYANAPFTKNQGSQALTLTGSGVYTGGTYTKTAGTGTLTLDASTGEIIPSSSDAGTYTITYTLAAVSPCTQVTATTDVIIYSLPTASIAGSIAVCENSSSPDITFTGANGTAPYSFTYKLNGGSDLMVTTTSGNSATVSQTSALDGTYTYTLISVSDSHGSWQNQTGTATITVTDEPEGEFFYAASPYCSNGTDPLPTYLEGGAAGTFSSSSGLVFISASTGEIDLSASTAGTYTITNTVSGSGGCSDAVETSVITINALPVATFSYSGSPYCNSAVNPSPTFIGGGEAGLFSASPAGIVFISVTTGEIDLTHSLPGAYTITNVIAAANNCGVVTSTAPITITATPVAVDITYPGLSFCKTSDQIAVNQTGTAGGVYTTSGAAGALTINSSSGLITPSSSTPGNYTITYTIAAAGGCSVFSDTYNLTITDAPTASIAYSSAAYCIDNTTAQTVTITGTSGGTFSTTAGLSMDASGTITPSSSNAGNYTVTYTIAAAGGCDMVTATTAVSITTPPTITAFSYNTPFCKDISIPQMPTLTGTAFYNPANAWYSSTAGLSLHAASGAVNPSTSTTGTYTVTYTIPASGGCAEVTGQATVVINALPAAPTAGDVAVTYDGSAHTGTATAPDGSTVVWYNAETAGTASAAPVGTNVGTYTAYAGSVVTATGCKSATRTLVTVQINAKALTVTATGPTKIYGTALSAGTSVTNFTAGATSVGSEAVTGVTLTPDAAGLSATTSAETAYVVTPTLATGSNGFLASNYDITYTDYNGTVATKQLTIADPTLTLSKEYNATTTAAVTEGALSGVEAGDVANVGVTAAANYDNANVGTAKTITVVYTLTGSAETNYIKPVDYSVTTGIITVKAIATAAIAGVIVPVNGGTPTATITATAEYTATISWSGTLDGFGKFVTGTIYTATITIIPTANYTLTGVAADFFIVSGTTSDANSVDSGVVTAVFPQAP